MIILPNPFTESVGATPPPADKAAAALTPARPGAAVVPISTNTPEASGTARKAPSGSLLGEPSRSTARASLLSPESTSGGPQEAPAVSAPPPTVAGDSDFYVAPSTGAWIETDATDCIGEIFHYARLLIAEDNAVHRRFVLDEARFLEAIEPPPLFLQAPLDALKILAWRS